MSDAFETIGNFDGEVSSNPFRCLAASNRTVNSNKWGGFLALLRHNDVKEAAGNPKTFSSEQGVALPPFGAGGARRPPLESDPPEHSDYRTVLNAFFSPRRMRRFEHQIREIARTQISECVTAGEVDAVASFTFPYPADVLCAFVGFPSEDAPFLKQVSSALVDAAREGRESDRVKFNSQIQQYVRDAVEKRISNPHEWGSDDLIHTLLTTPVNGQLLPVEGVTGVVRLVFFAGHGTTTNTLGSAIHFLATHPDVQQMLRCDPQLIPQAIEEVIRLWSPARMMSRTVTTDTQIAGSTVRVGEKVALVWSSANRDPSVFSDPDTFRIDRTPNNHMGFGSGIHTCAGAPLARTELRIAIEELLRATDSFSVAGTPQWATQTSTGPLSLPLLLTAATQQMQFKSTRAPVQTSIAATVRERVSLTDDVVEITLSRENGEPFPGWAPGAHIDVLTDELTRQYSIVSSPSNPTEIKIAILRESSGRGGSLAITDIALPGNTLEVRGPRNNFEFHPSGPVVFFAGGIGITPILPMVKLAAQQGRDWKLYYLGKSQQSMSYADEVSLLGSNATLWESTVQGRLNLEQILMSQDKQTEIYACGSQHLIDDLETLALQLNFVFHAERFTPKSIDTSDGALSTFNLSLVQSQMNIRVAEGQSILEACEQAGVPVQNSCRQGTCGSCELRVVQGKPAHRDSVLSQEDKDAGEYIISCVSRSHSKELRLDL